MKTNKENSISARFRIAKSKENTKRKISFYTGLIVSLSLAFTAFNIRTPLPSSNGGYVFELDTLVEEMIPITVIKEEVKEEKKVIKDKPKSPEQIEPTTSKAKSPDILQVRKETDEGDDFNLDSLGIDFEPENIESDAPFAIVQNFPTFPGECENIQNEEMRKNCTVQRMYEIFAREQVYPEIMRDEGIQGQVVVKFIVERDGSIGNIEILRGIAGGKMLEMEAKRLIGLLPELIPGSNRGRTVRVEIRIPMNFQLH